MSKLIMDATGLVAVGGRYTMDAPQLARFREAIAADATGRELVAIVTMLREKNYETVGTGWPPHPARLLRTES